MESKVKKPKQERTTPEQLKLFVEFCAANPVMTTGRNNPTAPSALTNLWEELADSLNAMRGPTKTAAQWKETLYHWRNMVRSRARQAVVHAKGTGGGPRTATTLNKLELRAVAVFGAASVSGLAGVRTLGFKSTAPDEAANPATARTAAYSPLTLEVHSPLTEAEQSPAAEAAQPSPLGATALSSDSVGSTSLSTAPQSPDAEYPLQPGPSRKKRRVDVDSEALILLKESVANRKQFEERALQAQDANTAALQQMASAMLALTQAITSANVLNK